MFEEVTENSRPGLSPARAGRATAL